MKTVIKLLVLFFSLSSLLSSNSNDKMFEKLKTMYASGKVKSLQMPYGKRLELKSIFGLPEKQQKKAWNTFLNRMWKNAGEGIKKEGTILSEGMAFASAKKKGSAKYSEYIRTPKEINQLIEKSTRKGISNYAKSCTDGKVFYCLQLGGNYFRGTSVKRNYKKARRYFSKACKLNSGLGCNYLGQIYYGGLAVKKDRKRALKLYDKACKLNEYDACIMLGNIYKHGVDVKKDTKIARRYYKKACNKKTKFGCGYL